MTSAETLAAAKDQIRLDFWNYMHDQLSERDFKQRVSEYSQLLREAKAKAVTV